MKLLRIVSSLFNKNKQLEIKAISAKNTYTAEEYSSYGTDARPIKDSTALYTTTERDGDECFIGVLNKNRKAGIGEHRIFCTDENGTFKFNIWLKSDGTFLIGNSDDPTQYTNFAVKYNETKQELDKVKNTLNTLIQKWNAFCSAYAPGSPSTTGTPPTLASSTVTANNSDFSLLKNEQIKTV